MTCSFPWQVSFPATLDISDLCAEGSIDPSPSGYTLYGVVVHLNHMNSTMYGHYVAYVKSEDQRWYLCDDSQVTQVLRPWRLLSPTAFLVSSRLARPLQFCMWSFPLHSHVCLCRDPVPPPAVFSPADQ